MEAKLEKFIDYIILALAVLTGTSVALFAIGEFMKKSAEGDAWEKWHTVQDRALKFLCLTITLAYFILVANAYSGLTFGRKALVIAVGFTIIFAILCWVIESIMTAVSRHSTSGCCEDA